MSNLPAEIHTVAGVRELDRCAIEDEGVRGYTLMMRAGRAAVDAALARFPDAQRWQVVCGTGNNAGDGYVVARLAAAEGRSVSVLTLIDPASLGGDAATAYGDFAAEGGVAVPWSGELDAEAELLVDAMLGSGLDRDVGGDFAAAVTAINAHGAAVVALDIPTGVNGDTGRVMGTAVRADLTVTFVGLKAGLFLADGRKHCGALEFAGLDVPRSCRERVKPAFRRMNQKTLSASLKRRARDAHKGDFGHVLIVGGGAGMPGAVRLAGEAALRTGAGLVSIATHPTHANIIVASRPELMSHAIEDPGDLEPLIEKADVVAFGPGLGQTDWSRALYDVVAALDLPAVWDADALNLLAGARSVNADRILTPHPGEAGRLLGTSAEDVQDDRRAALDALVDRYGGTCVLKGAGTLVSGADGVPWLCTSGNPGMAAPGMGDVLTGIVAALRAQGLGAETAAALGVEVHARAGDLAAARGERGLLASDLLEALRAVVNP